MNTYIRQVEIREELKIKYESTKKRLESDGAKLDEIRSLEKTYNETDDAIVTIFTSLSHRDYWMHLDSITDDEEEKKFKVHVEYVASVNERSNYYFEQDVLRLDSVDWLLTDYLIFGSYKILIDNMSESMLKDFKQTTFFNSMFNFAQGKSVAGAIGLIWFLAKWFLIIGLFLILIFNSTESPIFGVFALAMVGYFIFKRHNAKKQFSESMKNWQPKIDLIRKVYSLTGTSHIHWDILNEEITSSRRSGVEWCTSLYTAIKGR